MEVDKVKQINYDPKPSKRASYGLCNVNNTIYLFGGFGDELVLNDFGILKLTMIVKMTIK